MNKQVIEMAKDICDDDIDDWITSETGRELAGTILAIAAKTEPIRTRIHSMSIRHANTHPVRWLKRRRIEKELDRMMYAFFLGATADAEAAPGT